MSTLLLAVDDFMQVTKLFLTVSNDEVALKCCKIPAPYSYLVAENMQRFQCKGFHYKTQSSKVDHRQVFYFLEFGSCLT